MSKTVHTIYIAIMTLIVILVTVYLSYTGYFYYITPLEERFYLPMHDWYKPGGEFGHNLGIVGTALITFGVVIYIARKRYNFMAKYLVLKYLLEFHIFLCVLGPIMILFHTAFKFGGIVSIAFWSMVMVVLSGVIGRYIYIRIPRSIKGRELNLGEIKNMKNDLYKALKNNENIDEALTTIIEKATESDDSSAKPSYWSKYFKDKKTLKIIRKKLKQNHVSKNEIKTIVNMVKEEISLSNKIASLQTMQKLFKYWHVAHLPFAWIMLVILIVHVIATLVF